MALTVTLTHATTRPRPLTPTEVANTVGGYRPTLIIARTGNGGTSFLTALAKARPGAVIWHTATDPKALLAMPDLDPDRTACGVDAAVQALEGLVAVAHHRAEPVTPVPQAPITVVLQGLDTLMRPSDDSGRVADLVVQLLARGPRVGIVVHAITGDWDAVPPTLRQAFETVLAVQPVGRAQVMDVSGTLPVPVRDLVHPSETIKVAKARRVRIPPWGQVLRGAVAGWRARGGGPIPSDNEQAGRDYFTPGGLVDAGHLDPGRSVLLTGPAGTGKTVGVLDLLHRHPDRELYIADTITRHGALAKEPHAYLATTPEQVRDLADGVLAIARARMKGEESAQAGQRPVVVILEEIGALLNEAPEARHALAQILGLARHAGITVYATATKSTTVPVEMRRHFQVVATRWPRPLIVMPTHRAWLPRPRNW